MVRLTRAPQVETPVERKDRTWVPLSTLEQSSGRTVTAGHLGTRVGPVGGRVGGGAELGMSRGQVAPSNPPTPETQECGRGRAPALGCAHFQKVVHVTPASSACPQFVTPHLANWQWKMECSVPLQFTSSIQIFPVPAKRGAHSSLAAILGAERKRGAMPVKDMTVARLSPQALSNPKEAIFPLCYTENASLLEA